MNEENRQRLKELVPTIDFAAGMYPEDGLRFQRQLHDFILETEPGIVVETGVYCGCSTVHILAALDKNNKGHLYSCDPEPEITLTHPRWTFLPQYSNVAMRSIYMATGPWDVFLHDSNHFSFWQTYEYHVAWELLRPGGYLLSDDVTWGTPPHHAWGRFVTKARRVGSDEFQLGAARGVQKPQAAVRLLPDFDVVSAHAWQLAEEAQALAGDKEISESGAFR